MQLAYFPKHTALNGGPVLSAFIQGCQHLGIKCVENSMDADAAVVWSMLWQGRMAPNRAVYQHYRQQQRPVFVLEVGMLHRDRTWKLGINGTTGSAGWCPAFDPQRHRTLNLDLLPWRNNGREVVVMGQRTDSAQWPADVNPIGWHIDAVQQIQSYTDRPLVFRPHPRQRNSIPRNVNVQMPQPLHGTYDGFDFATGIKTAWAVVNFNSGPGSQSVMAGVPAFVHESSLAATVANLDLSQIENPSRPDRQTWINQIAHTEWTPEELAQGIPQRHLLNSNVFHASSA